MKGYLLLILSVIYISGCTKKDDNFPVGPESQDISGLWQTDGIVLLGNSNLTHSMSFQDGVLIWNVKFYSKSYPSNQFIFKGESTSNLNFTVDDSFIKIDPPVGNTYDNYPLYFHYSINNSRLTLDAGSIYTGSSNSLTGTEWNFLSTKYKYNPDNTGAVVYGTSDSIKFTYRVDGNTIVHNYDHHGRSTSYTCFFEIKNNKLYIYDKPGVGQSEPSSHTSESIILSRMTSAENEAKDFFPLKTGNSWTYDYGYSPSGGYGTSYTSGTLSWTVTSMEEKNGVQQYTIRETFSGKKYSFSSGFKDTVYIGPDTAYFNITENAIHRITINSVLTQLGQVNIKRFYSEITPDTLSVSTINYTSHSLSLVKAKGISNWSFGGRSNSDLYGSLRLTKYLLVK